MADRTFGDSVDPASIPFHQVDGVFPYVDGLYAWSSADIDRFKDAKKAIARITVFGDWRAACIGDVETGDMTPADAAVFVRARNRFRPDTAVIYCNRSTLPAVEEACAGLHYRRWVADWTGQPHTIPGVQRLVAVQYVNHPGYDLSVVFDDRWHPNPP